MRSGHRGSGPIATSNLEAGNRARVAVGTANVAEFVVTLAESTFFPLTIGFTHCTIIASLVTGGFAAAPLAAVVRKRLPLRILAVSVSAALVALSLRVIYHAVTTPG